MNFNRLIVILSICLGLKSQVVSADLYSATVAYQNKDYQAAYTAFKQLAELGNADAMYNLAVMALHGQGTTQSKPRAYAWFMLAGEFGADDAQQTAQLVLQSYRDPQVMTDMYQSLQKRYSYPVISKALFPPTIEYATKHNKQLSRSHSVTPKYPDEARRLGIEGWVWAEFDIDDNGAVTDISIVDSHPKNIFTASIINALTHWEYNVDKAVINRSLTYHFTTFKGKQYNKSLNLQRKEYRREITQHIDAAEQGNGKIQYYISQWLNSDKYNASKLLKYHWRDENADSALLLAAAKNNYPLAQYKLATSLMAQHNPANARLIGFNWLNKAAEHGLASAQFRLGLSYLRKTEAYYAPNQGVKWLTKAAEQDHFRAQVALIKALYSINTKPETIIDWIDKAQLYDSKHPTLLLYKAKLSQPNSLAKQLASKARESALSRSWSTAEIDQFIASLI